MKRPGHKYLLFLLDGLLINGSFLGAISIHSYLTGTVWIRDTGVMIPELLFWLACSTITMFVFITSDLYKINIYLSITRQVFAIVRAMSIAFIAMVVIAYFGKATVFTTSKIVLVSFYILSIGSLLLGRVAGFRLLYEYCARHKHFYRNVLIVGAGKAGRHLAEVLGGENPFALRLVGVLDDAATPGSTIPGGVSVLGRMDEVDTIVEALKVDEVIACPEGEPDERLLSVVQSCTRTRARVLVGSPEYRVIPEYTLQERYNGVPMFGMQNARAYMGLPALKRLLDLTLAIIGVIVLLPLLIAIAVIIRLDSPGPALFRHTRIGRNGRPFTFYKFRSMKLGSDNDPGRVRRMKEFVQNASGGSGESTKIVDESQVTRVGRFLRKSSLDELPQLLNVIRGEMSLVGPRPCLPYEWDRYSPWQRQRLSVTPGCTGLWQVTARSRVGFREMVILDIFYANNISFHLDLWVILKTFPVMLFGAGGR